MEKLGEHLINVFDTEKPPPPPPGAISIQYCGVVVMPIRTIYSNC